MSRNVLRLYVTADGKVAVRTFDEVGQASGRAADQVEKDSKKQAGSFSLVEQGASKMRGAVGALMGTVGLGGLAFGIADVVKAGENWQLQLAQTGNALRNMGIYSARTMDMVRKSAEGLSTSGGFAGPEEMQSISQFIRLTGSATRAIQLNRDATNLARGTNLGYTQAQRMIGQVLTGNTGRLQRYLGIIQPVKAAEFALSQAHKINVFQMELQSKALGKLGPSWLKLQEIQHGLTPQMLQHAQLLDRQATATMALQRIQERYGNATRTYSNTTAGAISNLRNRFNMLGETLGAKLLPVVNAVLGFLSKHTTAVVILAGAVTALGIAYGAVTAATVVWGGVTAVAGGVATVLGGIVGGLRTAILVLGLAFEEMGMSATVAWAAATLGVSLLIAGIVVAATHFQQFERIVTGIWTWLKNTVTTVVNWIGQHWKLLAVGGAFFLGGPFLALVVWATTHFRQFEQIVSSVINWIGRAWGTLTNVLAAPFVWAWQHVIRPVVNWIVGAVNWMVGVIKAAVSGIEAPFKAIGNFFGSIFGSNVGSLPLTRTAAGHAIPHRYRGGVMYAAAGGPIGTDTIPTWTSPGEFVLNREAVQNIGVQTLNSINATGSLAGAAAGSREAWVTMPITLMLPGGRIITEETVHTAARKAALSGAQNA